MEVVVPTETEIEIRNGVRREVERRVFPGYILVNMIMDEDSWYVVRNSPGVTGFVGMGNKPTPLRQEEVDKIMQRIESDEPRIKVSFQRGEHVRIMSGPFAEFAGMVDEIYPDKGKATRVGELLQPGNTGGSGLYSVGARRVNLRSVYCWAWEPRRDCQSRGGVHQSQKE